MRNRAFKAIFLIFLFLFPYLIFAQEGMEEAEQDTLAPPDTLAEILSPTEIKASDTPNDAGENITVQWKSPEDEAGVIVGYEIFRSEDKETGYEITGFAGKKTEEFKNRTNNGVVYYYKVRAKTSDGKFSPFSEISEGAISQPQWFHTGRINALVAVVAFISLLLFFVSSAKKGKSLFIRKIAGLDALDEAVGRATEMGKPILYVPGLASMSDVATIASINILGPVAKKVAEYESTIIVPNRDPIVMTVTRQVVKESFLEAGRPDAFNEDMVFFVTDAQFGFAAAVDGIMVREKPATNLFLGMFWAESLILAETGNITGAIQIAGTDAVAQLPFFVTACDYTIIGEELYAASAYLSRTPVLVGSLKAQDIGKAILIVVVFAMLISAIVNTVFLLTTDAPNAILSRIIEFIQGWFRV